MKKINLIFYTLFFAFAFATPANAGPVAAAISFVVGAVKASAVVKLALSVALNVATSMIQKAMTKKPVPPGIKIERTLTGGTNSRTILMGLYATAGSQVCPPMSHGQDGKTPLAYLTFVTAVADVPTTGLVGLVLNGERVSIGEVASEYGFPIGGKYAGKAWVKFYDGRQTVADPMLVAKYSTYVRPWGANRIGTGISYAILTFKFDRDLYKQEPDVKIIINGMPLYDPRFDSSVGGSGTQRWSDQGTHAFTTNAVVMIYNILRGVRLPGGQIYGGECSADDLPLSNWVAAMNVCDEVTATGDKRYQAGYEITVSDEQPVDVIEQLLKACSGSISEVGGVYKIRVGPPSLPVMFVTDEDILVSSEREFDPYPTVDGSVNAVYAAFPHPGENWNTHDAPPLISAEYVAQDDGVEQPADIQFPAVPYPLQVQRNMLAWLKDDRRWRRHSLSMGPYSFMLEPLDVIAWTSAHNGYENKLFEVGLQSLDLARINSTFSMREVDPADYSWTADDELPDPVTPGQWELPQSQAVPGWTVQPWSIKDGDGEDRRPALRLSWSADAAEDATALKIEVRLAGEASNVADFTVSLVSEGYTVVSEGILPSTVYEARARFVVNRATHWSSWLPATTGDILLGEKDGVVIRFPDGSAPIWNYDELNQLPVPPAEGEENAFVKETEKLYYWDATAGAWKPTVSDATIDDGTLTNAKFVAGIRAPGIGNTLPTLPSPDWPVGSQFVLTTDGKMYTNFAGVWKTGVAAADIDGAIQAAQIAGVNAAAVIGQMVAAQLADSAVTSDKIAANAVVAGKIAAGAVVAGNIVAGAINTEHLAAGAVVASKMFVGDTSNMVPDGAIVDPASWIFSASTVSIVTASPDSTSKNRFNVLPGTADVNVYSSWVPVQQNSEIFFSAVMGYGSGAIGGGSYVYLQTGQDDGLGNVSGVVNNTPTAVQTATTRETFGQSIVVPNGHNVARLRFRRVTGGVATALFDSPIIRRRASGELIVDGAITTDKLAANSVVAGTIAAGAINATHISAKAVTTSKLAVGDYSNLVNDNFSDLAAWSNQGTGGVVYETGNALDNGKTTWRWSTNRTGLGAFAFVGDTSSEHFSVEPGGSYHGTATVRLTAGAVGRHQIYILWYDASGAGVGGPVIGQIDADGTAKTVTIGGISTAPATAATGRLRMRVATNGAGVYTSGAYFRELFARRAASGELIVDGSIVTGKLAANAVTADKITAGAVTAAKINVTELSAISGNMGIITAGLIRSGTGGNRTEVDPNGIRTYVGGNLRFIAGQW